MSCRCEFCESERVDEQLDALAADEEDSPALLLVVIVGVSLAVSLVVMLLGLWALAVMFGLA